MIEVLEKSNFFPQFYSKKVPHANLEAAQPQRQGRLVESGDLVCQLAANPSLPWMLHSHVVESQLSSELFIDIGRTAPFVMCMVKTAVTSRAHRH